MEEKKKNHKCKLCFRIFPTSRSLTGHMMRSHHHQLSGGDDSSSYASESYLSAEVELEEVAYELRRNPRKNFRVAADPDSAESETESPQNLTRRRSQRTRKLSEKKRQRGWVSDSPPASSVSDAFPEEEVAMFLVMMSRDVNWRKRSPRFSNDDEDDAIEVREIKIAKKEDEEVRERSNSRVRRGINKLKCEKCTKQFRSSPALTTHRRICSLNTDNGGANAAAAETRRIFRCPYCYKVFGSGQALGGHKRSHLSSTTGSYPSPAAQPPVKSSGGLLDLNFPPAATEDDDYSVVSDA